MGWDRNEPYMTCGEYEDACERAGINGDPFVTIERMREALMFYAVRSNYNQRGWQGDPDPSLVQSDAGQKARMALGLDDLGRPQR